MDLSFGTEKPDLIFTSWIKDVDRAYAGLDIVSLSSLNEGTPVSLIEAQAAGKPIISTRVGGVEDVVSEGQSGLLSESDNEEEMAENLLKMVENDDLRAKMAGFGRENVMNRYSRQRLVKDMFNLYNQLLQERTRLG